MCWILLLFLISLVYFFFSLLRSVSNVIFSFFFIISLVHFSSFNSSESAKVAFFLSLISRVHIYFLACGQSANVAIFFLFHFFFLLLISKHNIFLSFSYFTGLFLFIFILGSVSKRTIFFVGYLYLLAAKSFLFFFFFFSHSSILFSLLIFPPPVGEGCFYFSNRCGWLLFCVFWNWIIFFFSAIFLFNFYLRRYFWLSSVLLSGSKSTTSCWPDCVVGFQGRILCLAAPIVTI